jgi:hypothetical protein
VRSESVHLREYTCYRVDFLFPQGVPSALILELRQRADTGDKTLDAGTECLDLADGLSVQVDQSQPGVIVGWSSSKSWLQQQWETLETRVGLRSRAYPDVLER